MNTDAASYIHRPVRSVLEIRRCAKESEAQAGVCWAFIPFICSTDGAIHREGQHFLRRLSARLASKLEMAYSRAMSFVNVRLSLAILRASVHCLPGARRRFFSLSNDSGAAIALLSWIVFCLFSLSSSRSRALLSSPNAWLADLLIISYYYWFSEFHAASFFRLFSDSLYIFFILHIALYCV